MAYLLLLATLVTFYVRPGDINPALAGVPILPTLAVLFALSVMVSWMARLSKPVLSPHLWWIMGTWGAFVFSHAGRGYLEMTTQTFTGFFPNVFVVFAMTFVLNSERRLKGFSTLWILLALFLAVAGIVQSVTGTGLGGQPLIKGRIQGVGIFADPNDLALAFLIAVPLAHARFRLSGTWGRVAYYALAAVFTYATFLTNSRGGILALLLVFFALSAHRLGPKMGVALGSLLVLALLAIGPSRINQISSKEESAQGRIVAWSEGLQMLKRSPLIGVGYGMFTDYHPLTAHNSFVLCFAETGLLGAFFWIGLIYVSLLGLRRVVKTGGTDPPAAKLVTWSKGTQVAFLGFLSGIFFLSRTYNILLYLLVGFASAVYCAAKSAQPDVSFRLTLRDRFKIAGIVVGGIILTYVLVKTLAVWTGGFY
ncbi:MAG: O-antigen ligase family protein [Pseudomonadota bacterium]